MRVRVRVRVWEWAVPSRLGRSFRWLLGAAVINNIGDGIALAAGPLLVASLTKSPLLVSLAPMLQQVPFVLVGLGAGAIVDRVDRRKLIVVVDVLRAVIVAALAAIILTGQVSIGAVLVIAFLLGTCETFADVASSTLLPSMVAKADLGVANARMMGAFVTANQLAGPPLGAFLFAAGMFWPFGVNAIAFALGAVLISRIRVRPVTEEHRSGASMRHDIAEGIRWLVHNPPMRTLALTIVTFNVTFGAAWGVLVLWAQQRLGVGPVGFGLLTTVSSIGGVLAVSLYDWLSARLRLSTLMRIGLILETLTHLALALITHVWAAYAVMFVFGAHAFVWGTTSTTIRQRVVPDHLMGRVGSVYMIGVFLGIVIGNPIGGWLAGSFGITAPYWFAFVGSAALVAAVWGQLHHIAHEDG